MLRVFYLHLVTSVSITILGLLTATAAPQDFGILRSSYRMVPLNHLFFFFPLTEVRTTHLVVPKYICSYSPNLAKNKAGR